MIKSELTSKEISKTLTLEAVGYRFTGTACIIDWYNNHGSIKMKPFNIYFSEFNTHEEFMALLQERLNDNEFGAQDLRGALVDGTVLAADVDPDANLGLALGLSQEEVDAIIPISKMRDLAKERTGASDDNKFYKLNPYVADIPEKFAKSINGVKLLVMGTVDLGGSGCVCPEHVMLKSILSAMTYRKDDVVIMDMEAGLEHLGRGTAANMDQFIVVIEPGSRSVQTYRNVKRLAADLGVKRVRVVANKIRDEQDEQFIRSQIPEEDLLGFIHYNLEIMDADRNGKSPYDYSPAAIEEIRKIKEILDKDD